LNCKKVEKLEIEELQIDLALVNRMCKVFEEENSLKFLKRLKYLSLSNIKFVGDSEG
jgi:hypothetical protein